MRIRLYILMSMHDVSAQRWAWAGAIALAVAMGIGRFVYTPILPAMASALSLGHATAGWIASANFAGYLVGAIGASSLTKRPMSATVAGLFLSAATTAAMGAVSSPALFIVLRAIGGAASAIVLVGGSAIVLDRLQAKGRAGLTALHFAGVGIGIALSAVLVAALNREGMDWRGLWYASGALSFAGSIAVVLLLPRGGVTLGDGQAPQNAPSASGSYAIPALLAAYGLFGFGYVITATFLVVQVRSTAPNIEPFVWLIVGLSAVPSVAAWTWIGARVGLLSAYALASVIEAIGVADSVLVPTIAGALIAALLLGATFVGLTALGLRAAREASATPQRILAWMTVSFGLGQIIGPIFAGQLAAHTGNFMLPTLVAAGALVLAAALTGIQRS
jgi:MFS family permease